MQFFSQQFKLRKRLSLLALAVVLVLLGSFLEQRVLKVTADVQVLLVSDTNLPFGTVFPGQTLVRAYTVQLDTSAASSSYVTVLNSVAGFTNLCPHLIVSSIDTPAEPDTLATGTLIKPSDMVDNWQVKLNVPGIAGQVSQDHNGQIVITSGDSACKITVTTDLGETGGCSLDDCTPPGPGPTTFGSSGGGGGGSSGGSGIPTNPGGPNGDSINPPGEVAGLFTNIPSNGSGGNDPSDTQVLGEAIELPRTGMPMWYILSLLFVSMAINLKLKKSINL